MTCAAISSRQVPGYPGRLRNSCILKDTSLTGARSSTKPKIHYANLDASQEPPSSVG
ncbi:hypothetical protein CBOM_04604 [Ceraceosorus bombacis]|uniref:Uncharacterized protein n=1 Tax=Ceraceosorus bombacis TaxID=401625 RepID=A0A0P1BMS6_9BASI|nr:hypothetical protein CBOM_04604 [Ceraceosorus bombacis]